MHNVKKVITCLLSSSIYSNFYSNYIYIYCIYKEYPCRQWLLPNAQYLHWSQWTSISKAIRWLELLMAPSSPMDQYTNDLSNTVLKPIYFWLLTEQEMGNYSYTIWTKILGSLHTTPAEAAQPWKPMPRSSRFLMLMPEEVSRALAPFMRHVAQHHFVPELLWFLNASI